MKAIPPKNADTTSEVRELGAVRNKFSMQGITAGSPTGGTVTLEGSLDGQNFDATNPLATFTIGTDASGAVKFAIDKPVAFCRVVLAGLVGGTSPTVTAIVGVGGPA